MSKVVLDTNILLRLANPAAAEHEVCRTAVTRVVEAGNTLATAPQILVDFWVVATRPVDEKRAHDARIAAVMLTSGVTELVTLNTDDFKNMPDLVVRHPAAVAP